MQTTMVHRCPPLLPSNPSHSRPAPFPLHMYCTLSGPVLLKLHRTYIEYKLLVRKKKKTRKTKKNTKNKKKTRKTRKTKKNSH